MKKIILLSVLLILAFVLIGCGEKDTADNPSAPANQEPVVEQPAQPAPAKLVIVDKKVGTGKVAVDGKTVVVNYKGWLDDGTVFDTSKKEGRTPFEFTLGAGMVIKGWDEGVKGMKVGGIRELTIPSDLGYGERGAGNLIKPGATLHFEVELLDVK